MTRDMSSPGSPSARATVATGSLMRSHEAEQQAAAHDGEHLAFATEPNSDAERPALEAPWKLLIVDDEEQVHRVTKVALTDFLFEGRPLEILDAYSGRQSIEIMRANPDVGVILMDAVMETESAGLDAVEAIRTTLGNRLVRIIIRTGQAGLAPEREVVTRYDINDYKEKTEMTARRLYSTVYTSLGAYADLVNAKKAREFLERCLTARTARLADQLPAPASLSTVAAGVPTAVPGRSFPEHPGRSLLLALSWLFGLDRGETSSRSAGLLVRELPDKAIHILTGIGRCSGSTDPLTVERLRAALESVPHGAKWSSGPGSVVLRFYGGRTESWAMYLESEDGLHMPDGSTLELFHHDLSIAIHYARNHDELTANRRELLVTLSEAIKSRFSQSRPAMTCTAPDLVRSARIAGPRPK